MTNDTNWSLTTRLVHEGERGARIAGTPTSMPIYATATYLHPSAAELDQAFTDGGLVYGRYGNPTVNGFEVAVALLEGGVGAVAFGSGMAALHAAILAAGTPRGATQPSFRHVLAARDMYGTTRTLLNDFFGAQGITTDFVDMGDLEAVKQSIAARRPDVVVVEPISNPLLKLVDLPALTELCRAAGARLVVDNTLPTPLMLRPLLQGADFAVHSATKYLGGHGDVIGGVVAARSRLPLDNLRTYSKLLGAVLGPFDARLLA
nr:PLP-dependent transferase [Herpetosiphonaceae bacterium]